MKDHTTAEIFEELWKRIEYDANVSEELATESNELQARINKAIEYIKENYDNATYTYSKDKDIYCKCFDDLLEILKGEKNV